MAFFNNSAGIPTRTVPDCVPIYELTCLSHLDIVVGNLETIPEVTGQELNFLLHKHVEFNLHNVNPDAIFEEKLGL